MATDRRKQLINFRVSERERQVLDDLARRRGQPVSAFMRDLIGSALLDEVLANR